MADQPPRRRFTIRPLTPEETREQQASARQRAGSRKPPGQQRAGGSGSTPQQAKPPASAAAPERPATGALFPGSRQVLAFIGAVAGAGLTDSASLQRGPDDRWWSQVDLPPHRVANLIQDAGGRPFARVNGQWTALSPTGELPGDGAPSETLNVSGWKQAGLDQLLAGTALLPGRYTPTAAVDVVAPGTLARWILKRAAGLGLEIGLVPIERQPLAGADKPSSATLLRLRSPRGSVPMSLVRSIGDLPYTIVSAASNTDSRGLLVDVRHQLPSPSHLLTGMIPEGESWVIGPDDVGRWRIRPAGHEIDAAGLLDAPQRTITPAPATPAVGLQAPIAVRLIPRRGGRHRVDAVLIDETELDWLRRYLATRPAGELAFLLPGDGAHLLTAPGGLPTEVPFGIPLVHTGPGGLYLELGRDFDPPLPDGARQARFELTADSVVAVTESQAYRFRIADLIPAWTLWVGEPMPIQTGLSPQGRALLTRVAGVYRQADLEAAQRQHDHGRLTIRPLSREDRAQRLEEAQRAELSGDLVRAAELLESAGYPGQAGRLYERAALSQR